MPMKITTTSTLQQHRCDGTSLIEVLVTLVILSIGLLGLAALQLNGLRSNTSAALRTASTLIAGDIIERMRANPTAVTDGLFSNVNTADVGSVNCGALPNQYCS